MLVNSVSEPLRRLPNVLALTLESKQVNTFTFIDYRYWQNVLVGGWEHFLSCEATYSWNRRYDFVIVVCSDIYKHFKIVARARRKCQLDVLEAICISRKQPEICIQKEYVRKLYLFWGDVFTG